MFLHSCEFFPRVTDQCTEGFCWSLYYEYEGKANLCEELSFRSGVPYNIMYLLFKFCHMNNIITLSLQNISMKIVSEEA